MGYTHYFTTTGASLNKDQADGIIKSINKVFKQHKRIIQREFDNPAPAQIETALNLSGKLAVGIFLNGIGEDGHETFAINTGASEWGFCKTARKPYDIVVCKVLLILKHYLGDDIKVESDGFSSGHSENKLYKKGNKVLLKHLDGTWSVAARSVNRLLGSKYKFIVDDVYGRDGECFSYKLNK